MVSHRHKCIFIHIPKTGGMSVENCFLESLGLRFYLSEAPPLLLSHNKNMSIGPHSLAHLAPLEYVKYSYITQEQFNDYFKFSIIRNPYERAVSIYKHFQYHRILSFTKFIKYEFPKLMENMHYFVKPQSEYLFDEKGTLLVDYVGVFENLEKELDSIQIKISHPIADLKHINKSIKTYNIYSRWNLRYIIRKLREKPYLLRGLNIKNKTSLKTMEHYTKESLEFVNSFYEKDFTLFHYQKITVL